MIVSEFKTNITDEVSATIKVNGLNMEKLTLYDITKKVQTNRFDTRRNS